MNTKLTVWTIAALGVLPVCAGWNLNLSEGWRITGGAEFGGPVNANVRMRGAGGAHGNVPMTTPGASAKEAEEAVAYRGGRIDYGNGAFIDPASSIEEDPNWTWNWHLPPSAKTGLAGSSSYREVTATESIVRTGASDDGWNPGVSLEFARTLWTWDEHPFGVDFAFGLAWQRCNNLVSSEQLSYVRDETVRSGAYATSLGEQKWFDDPWTLPEDDGYYGAGTYNGPGPVMDLALLGTERTSASESATRYAERVRVQGDWEEWDFRFTLKPWWEVTDWLRLYGTVGLELARTHFGMNVGWSASDGQRGGRGRDFDEWQVNGLAGLGAAVNWKHMTLGADFMARFLQQDLTINDREMYGTIDRQTWFFRVYVGAEF